MRLIIIRLLNIQSNYNLLFYLHLIYFEDISSISNNNNPDIDDIMSILYGLIFISNLKHIIMLID